MTSTLAPSFRTLALTTVLLCGLSYSLAAEAALKPGEQALDNIVAVVNDSVITQTELEHATTLARRQLSADNVSTPPLKTLHKQILQQLINNKLQLETAEQTGIHVDEAELAKVVDRIAKDNHLTIKEFYEKLAQEGLTPQAYRTQIRESLTLQHLQQREVASRITVSPEEINDSLRSASLELSGEKEYHIQDLLVPVSDTPTPQELAIAKKFAEDLLLKLQKGTPLNQLASAEAASLQDNDLNWRKLTEVPTAFTEPVSHMKVNTFSSPIQTSNGFHIVHLVGLRSLSTHAPKPQRQEVAQAIFQRKFEEAMQGWLAKVRGQAFIEIYDKAIT